MGHQLQKSKDILSVWDVYAELAGCLSKQLQTLQRDISSELSVTPGQNNTVDWVNVKIHKVQVRQ